MAGVKVVTLGCQILLPLGFSRRLVAGGCLERLTWMCALASVDLSKGGTVVGWMLIRRAENHRGTRCLKVLKPN